MCFSECGLVVLKICSLAQSVILTFILQVPSHAALSAESKYAAIPEKNFTSEPTKDIPENLDNLFIFPTKSSIKFNSALWKDHVASRPYMLFDLYHQPLNEYTAEKVYEMLGAPNELTQATPSSNNETATYDLGFLNGSRAMLVLHLVRGKIIWLTLKRMTSHFSSLGLGTWQRKNMNWATFAHELNDALFIVGVPVHFLLDALGYGPQMEVGSAKMQRIGDMEFESSEDDQTVKRIRVYYLNREGVEVATPWESTNERKRITNDPRFLSRKSEMHNLQNHRSIYLQPFMNFSSEKWKTLEPAYLGFRIAMIPSLVRNYPLIGMSRIEVQELLGNTETPKNDVFSETDSQSPNSDFSSPRSSRPASVEIYAMIGPHCGNGGAPSFELEFKDDRVIGYRVHHSGGLNSNWGSSCGALFGFPDLDSSSLGH